MRVLRLIARLNVGGPARHAAILDAGLGRRGFETLLVHGRPGPGEASLEALAAARSLRMRYLPELGRRIALWSDVRALAQVVRLIFQERPDVVHTHTAKAGTLGRLAALAYNATRSRQQRCLVVHTFHGHVFTGYFGRAGSAAVRLAERALALTTDRIVTISERQRRDVVERFGVAPARKVSVVPLGLELEWLLALEPRPEARRVFDLTGEDVVFGYVGRFVPIKDLDTLLRAFAQARRACEKARLLMVGEGERRGALEALADALGIAASVRFVGWELDLPRVYAALDIVALSSLNEGTPVALIEGMAAGLPVVATAVGGVPDVVNDERTGLLVPPGRPEDLARAMIRLAAEPGLRARLGTAARESVRARFAADRLVSDMADLYVQGVRRKRRTG